MGLARQKLGNAEQAGKDFERAVKVDPRDPSALFHYAKFLEDGLNAEEALRYYCLAMERNPKPDLRKLIHERISALDTTRNSDVKRQKRQKERTLW